ncbi:efflux RND transporter periplasmic adaptor subunit, partial [bacterium]|nr:efflux RND transporter periplasmic adaptor subunit [bacterium]
AEAVMKSEAQGYYRLAVNPLTKKIFALGDNVKKDLTIVYLDNPEQENNIKIESHKLNLGNTQREYEKQKSLYEKGGVTLRDLKNSEISYIDAKYAYENALIQLAKLQIKAPFDGIITGLPYYTEGVKVQANTEIVHIMNYRILKMEVNLPGKIMEDVKVGQPIRVNNYQYPDNKLSGVITQVSPTLDPDTRTFKAVIDVKNPDRLLRPGMFVKAEIITAKKENTIVIPKDVILSRRNRKTVFIVVQGYARERRIETGLENPGVIEITKGLNENERLVIKGFETLINGSKVRISQEG